jgi:hypothetical protein
MGFKLAFKGLILFTMTVTVSGVRQSPDPELIHFGFFPLDMTVTTVVTHPGIKAGKCGNV